METDEVLPFRSIDAYTLADAARRRGAGGVIHDLRPQTRASTFVGRALTARVDYQPHRDIPLKDYGGAAFRDRAGPGDVAVLDGGGQWLTAMGALAAAVLSRRGAAAAVVNACVRDVEQIEEQESALAVFALGTAITTIAGHGFVTGIGEPLYIQGIRIASGDLLAGCRGGIVVVPWERRGEVLEEAQRICESDRRVLEGIARGESMSELWQRHKRFDQ